MKQHKAMTRAEYDRSTIERAEEGLGPFCGSFDKYLAMVSEANTNEYIAALKAHDWFYGYADDADIYGKGKAQRDALKRAQPALDPDWSIWNQHCHPEFTAKPVFPKGAN